MNLNENPPAPTLEWQQPGITPDWSEFPAHNRQEILTILADMLLNCQKKAQEGEDELPS